MRVIGSVFSGRDKPGDFGWMIEQPDDDDALFVFNDNEEQFLRHQRDPHDRSGCSAGGGNAVIRPYQCMEPPRAAGIPTGAGGQGYSRLDAHVQSVIDDAVTVIRALASTGRYQRIFYSAAADGTTLGTGIFDVGDDVKDYIVTELRKLDDGA
jgi:hypothetical protein